MLMILSKVLRANSMLGTFRRCTTLNKEISRCKQTSSKDVVEHNDADSDANKPVQYSKSKAVEWQAKYTRRGKSYYETPAIEAYSVIVSFCAFMIYFGILREENDLDEWLGDVYNAEPMKIEEAVLRSKIAREASQGKDVTEQRKTLQMMVEKRTKGALHM